MICVVATLMVVSGGANSYELRRYSIEEKVRESSVIFMGEVEQVVDLAPNANSIRTVARFRVTDIYKGRIESPNVELITRGFIVEMDPDCCVSGRTYLVFGHSGVQDFVAATNGPYGVYEVRSGAVVGWESHVEGEAGDLDEVTSLINCVVGDQASQMQPPPA